MLCTIPYTSLSYIYGIYTKNMCLFNGKMVYGVRLGRLVGLPAANLLRGSLTLRQEKCKGKDYEI